MGHALHDLSRHNAWATAQLLQFCQGLDAAILESTVPGTYATILGATGHEPPNLSGWEYAVTSGRSTLKT